MTYIRTLLLAIVLIFLSLAPANAQWHTVGTAAFSPPNVHECDLAIDDSTGEVFVAFNSYSFSGSVSVMRFTGTSWMYVGASSFTSSFAHDPSIAIHPATHQPYVAFAGSGGISVMKFDGTNWTVVGQAAIGIGTPVLRFNHSTNEPYLALNDGTTVVFKYHGTSWQQLGAQVGSSVTNPFAREIDLVFNPGTNEPFVIFADATAQGRPVVKKYNGSSWVQVGNIVSDSSVQHSRLAIDSATGQLYFAYSMVYSNGPSGLHCRTLTGTTWTEVGWPGFGYSAPESIALGISPATHRPYLAYTDAGPKVVKFDGYNWQSTGYIPRPNPGGGQVAMAFHPFSHEPYLLHNSSTFCTVSKLDYCSVSTLTVDTACNRYMRPDSRGYYTVSGTYTDTLLSSGFCDSLATVNLVVKVLDTSVTRVGNVWTANQNGATYQWIYCNGVVINGATSQSYTRTGSAPVRVIINYDGCAGQSVCPPAPINVNAIELTNKMLVYPNPTSGELHFESENSGDRSIEVYDAAGRRIASYEYVGTKRTIRFEGPSGIYYVRFISSGGTVDHCVIQKH